MSAVSPGRKACAAFPDGHPRSAPLTGMPLTT